MKSREQIIYLFINKKEICGVILYLKRTAVCEPLATILLKKINVILNETILLHELQN